MRWEGRHWLAFVAAVAVVVVCRLAAAVVVVVVVVFGEGRVESR